MTKFTYTLGAQKQDGCRISGRSNHPAVRGSNMPMHLRPLVVGGKPSLVTLFGERDPSSLGHQGTGKMLGDVRIDDVDLAAWSTVAASGADASNEPSARGWFDADVVSQSEILLLGGLGEANDRLSDVWLLKF
jgi:hypothetical protein